MTGHGPRSLLFGALDPRRSRGAAGLQARSLLSKRNPRSTGATTPRPAHRRNARVPTAWFGAAAGLLLGRGSRLAVWLLLGALAVPPCVPAVVRPVVEPVAVAPSQVLEPVARAESAATLPTKTPRRRGPRLPAEVPRVSTLTDINRIYTEGAPTLDGWAAALDFADFADAIWSSTC